MKLSFNTGRDYGAPQILEIESPEVTTADLQLVEVYFNDAVRGISGLVELLDIETTPNRIGRAVLAEYDEGRYKPV